VPSEEGVAFVLAGAQSGWGSNPNDDEWNEESSHIISLAISREANVLMTIRGQQSSGEVVEINLRFGSTADSTYTGGGGYPGVNHYEDIPTGTWGHAAFDAAEVIRAQYGDSVDLAQIDSISVFGYGKTEIADFALLGTSHASYTAWGESLASALTGDILSPLAQASAWMREGATSPVGWQSKSLDPALGLSFNHARFYSAGMGRFTQASPLGADFEHLYGYGLNSPAGFTDVNGYVVVEVHVHNGPSYKNHAYILVTREDGTRRVYRGGPAGPGPGSGSSGTPQSSNATAGSSRSTGFGDSWGNLTGRIGKYRSGAWDWHPLDDEDVIRDIVIDDDRPFEYYDDIFQEVLRDINASHIPYKSYSDNSNSTVNEMLKAAGHDYEPEDITLIGWENELPINCETTQ
jgi:RHS repeat-associated protein